MKIGKGYQSLAVLAMLSASVILAGVDQPDMPTRSTACPEIPLTGAQTDPVYQPAVACRKDL